MAQRTVHILLAVLASKKLKIKDLNKFYLGSILPDAYEGIDNRLKTHFIKTTDNNETYCDLNEFYEKYKTLIIEDDLYFGYYAHLVEDVLFRYYMYIEKNLLVEIKKYDRSVLHNDYHILNSYITKNYELPADIHLPEDYNNNFLNHIYQFEVQKIINDYSLDLKENVEGILKFLTPDFINGFLIKYLDILIDELINARNGKTTINMYDYKYRKL